MIFEPVVHRQNQLKFNKMSKISRHPRQTLDVSVDPVILMKFAPASVASALARSVFPVPGGPKSNIPLQG